MMKKLFVTATDTDAGKTLVTSALLLKLSNRYTVAGFKPISAGCELINGELFNDDAKQICQYANVGQTIQQINPITFEQPIAPHIAAGLVGKRINLKDITDSYLTIEKMNPDFIVTEGAGGWRLPLGSGQFLSELPVKTAQQVILVVNMKLGCLNHALLTYEAINNDNLECVGWISNNYQDMPYLAENLALLSNALPMPNLGHIGFVSSVEEAAKHLNITSLYI